MNKTDRIRRLIVLKRLGILTNDEMEELHMLLQETSEFQEIHDHIMDHHDLMDMYTLYRSSKQMPTFDQLLDQKGIKHSPHRSMIKVVRYCAAILLPLVLFISYMILQGDKGNDLDPKPFVARLQAPDMKQHILSVSAVESYSTQKLTTIPAQKEHVSDDLYLLSTSPNDEFKLTLEDGTMVHLNQSTEFYFPEHFDTKQRKVFLRGEAYFKVAHDTRPFLVVTDAGTIRQYGTSFHVKAYDRSPTEVVLVEGSIGIIRQAEPPVMMKPGQISRWGLEGENRIQVQEIDPTPYIAWETGRFNFEDYPLSGIMEVLRKWYDIDYVFHDPASAQLRFSGDIDRYGSISPVLKAISEVAGVKIELSGHQVIIGN